MPFPPPGDLSDEVIESSCDSCIAGRFFMAKPSQSVQFSSGSSRTVEARLGEF